MKQHQKKKKNVSGRDAESIPRPFGATRQQMGGMTKESLYVALSQSLNVVGATGGTLALRADNSQVSSATEWSVMAQVWGEFRVISMTLIFQPVYTDQLVANLGPGGTLGWPGPHASASFGGVSVSGGYINIIDNAGVRFHKVGDVLRLRAAAVNVNPFALEWTPTNAAVPANQQFGIIADSTVACPGGFNGVVMGTQTVYWDVEFRGRR